MQRTFILYYYWLNPYVSARAFSGVVVQRSLRTVFLFVKGYLCLEPCLFVVVQRNPGTLSFEGLNFHKYDFLRAHDQS
jgi:hypothetical protein